MKIFYVYNITNGRITSSGYASPDSPVELHKNQKIIFDVEASPLVQYHNLETDKLTQRPTLNIDNITLTVDEEYNPQNIPAGTIVYVDDENVGVVDNTGLTLVFPVAKQYAVKLVPPFPYIKKSITVEVV